MRVTPITAEKANEGGGFEPWPAGDYDYAVYDASEETSTKGNEQIKLTLHVFNRDGNKRTVFDYLVNTPEAQWKMRHFADSCGMTRQYEAGEMDTHDIVAREGRLKLRIKPKTDQYAANNSVQDYIPAEGVAQHAPAPSRATASRPAAPSRAKTYAGDIDDDIPFAPCWQ